MVLQIRVEGEGGGGGLNIVRVGGQPSIPLKMCAHSAKGGEWSPFWGECRPLPEIFGLLFNTVCYGEISNILGGLGGLGG